MERKARWVAALAAVAVVVGAASVWAYTTAPAGTLDAGPADVLMVFGTPADITGAPTTTQMWRVREAVAEYRRGAAPNLLFTGGPAANRFVEAEVMAAQAVRLGVPASAITMEGHSITTVDNIRRSLPLLQQRGWRRVELISSADHLPRIAVLMHGAPVQWRLHAAPTPGRGRVGAALAYVEEAPVTLLLRIFGSRSEPVIHGLAAGAHKLAFCFRWCLYRLQGRFSRSDSLRS